MQNPACFKVDDNFPYCTCSPSMYKCFGLLQHDITRMLSPGTSSTNSASFPGIVRLDLGDHHSMILKHDGSVWSTALAFDDSLIALRGVRNCFTQSIASGVTALAAGSYHSVILKQDGSVWVSGSNEYGQLGAESTAYRKKFVQTTLRGAVVVAAGAYHSMVVKQDNSIWATGANMDGQLGDGSTLTKNKFFRLAPFDDGLENPSTYPLLLLKHTTLLLSYCRRFCLPACLFLFAWHFTVCQMCSLVDFVATTKAAGITVPDRVIMNDGRNWVAGRLYFHRIYFCLRHG